MKTWKLTSLLMMVCVWTFTLTSCGDDVTYYTIQNSDEMLCSRTWVEEYDTTNEDGVMVSCVHQLKFSALNNDKSGQEIHQYYYTGESRPYYETSRNFSWEWLDNTKEGLRIDFGGGNVVYFENVWVREHYLSGKLNGAQVTFTDANYHR